MSRSSTGRGDGPPAPLPGIEALTPRNEARLIWWAIRSRFYGAGGVWFAALAIATAAFSGWKMRPFGAGTAIVTVAVVLGTFLAGAVALVAVVQLVTDARRRRRGWLVGYFTADASQLVHPDRTGAWILSDHFARRRGHGLAAAFRRQVFGHLAAEADRLQVVIMMDTHAKKLARIYTHDMPGLRVVTQRRRIVNGPIWSLQREPRSTRRGAWPRQTVNPRRRQPRNICNGHSYQPKKPFSEGAEDTRTAGPDRSAARVDSLVRTRIAPVALQTLRGVWVLGLVGLSVGPLPAVIIVISLRHHIWNPDMYPNAVPWSFKTVYQQRLKKKSINRLTKLEFAGVDIVALTDGEVASLHGWLRPNVLRVVMIAALSFVIGAAYVILLYWFQRKNSDTITTNVERDILNVVLGVALIATLVLFFSAVIWLARWLFEPDLSLGVSVRALIMASKTSLTTVRLNHVRQLARHSRTVQKRARRVGIDLDALELPNDRKLLQVRPSAVAEASLTLAHDARSLMLRHVSADLFPLNRWTYRKWGNFAGWIPSRAELGAIILTGVGAFVTAIVGLISKTNFWTALFERIGSP